MEPPLWLPHRKVRSNYGNGYQPDDIRRAYHIPAEWLGHGQTMGLLAFARSAHLHDARRFWHHVDVDPPHVKVVHLFPTNREEVADEPLFPLQWLGALAPQAKIVVYLIDPQDTYHSLADDLIRALDMILHDHTHRLSTLMVNYTQCEFTVRKSDALRIAELVESLDAQGTTVCFPAGDHGAYGMHDVTGELWSHADTPAACPAAVSVGGTRLEPDGSESSWQSTEDIKGATGGGFSVIFSRPDFQYMLPSHGRGIPDIALNADPATGYEVVDDGDLAVVGGTSMATAVFTAVVALVNERRAQQGYPPLTHLTRWMYEKASELGYKDVTEGDNSCSGAPGETANVGWDSGTGWGSFDATQFLTVLSQLKDTSVPEEEFAAKRFVRNLQPSLRFPVIRARAVIGRVEEDASVHGVHHHHLLIRDVKLLDADRTLRVALGEEIFCAIRYGDHLGLPGPISGLTEGDTIELQGEYIDQNHAYPSIGNPRDAVIHYTHRPVGYVIYRGVRYE